ncbi:hypothetical protein [Fluviicola taffensis]|uniref:Glycosyltransferase RgtA/B/C/D-like domain-containing protein n=1 Tax=Fluviicola taffensis (strain DSM 16823 / NCIMB 13979 / RW262) TaxID=755732 RepID=F2IDT5_FLUTR|nr:hypothetical protein [Fluviicola taffensis]AEA44477.1 hypothetical protein Fluta_2492 [Fluviicola taffensis DSM 16823]
MFEVSEFQKKIIYYVGLSIIIILSYSLYSSTNYPFLNSDDGLNILMAHYYKLPEDHYCWGQDRGGTIIPLISQFFIKVFGYSAIRSVSLTNYLILILGYIGFSSILQKRSTKLLFACILFLPFQRFIDITRYPIGVQYSFIAFSIYLIKKLNFSQHSFFYWKNHLLLIAITLLFGISIWASDLAIPSISLLLLAILAHHIYRTRSMKIRPEVWFYLIIGSFTCTRFIVYAKAYATQKTENFSSINQFDDILNGLIIVKNAIWDFLAFRDESYFMGLYAWSVIIIVGLLILFLVQKKIKIQKNQEKWLLYFLFDFIGILGVIFLSHWVFLNGMGNRYFIGTYIACSMIILILFEHVELSKLKKIAFNVFVGLTVLIGTVSTIHLNKYLRPEGLKPAAETAREFDRLGKIGIIADYWWAFRAASPNPDQIKATPNDLSPIRKQMIVDDVLAQKKIYLIRDAWMDKFPDTVRQFGFTLLKSGKEFFLGGGHICRYKRLPITQTIKIPQLLSEYIATENNQKIVRLKPDLKNKSEKIIAYGPYITLPPGNYTVRYHIKAIGEKSDQYLGVINIGANNPQETLLNEQVFESEMNDDYNYYTVKIKTSQFMRGVEFRFINNSNLTKTLSIDHIELIEEN